MYRHSGLAPVTCSATPEPAIHRPSAAEYRLRFTADRTAVRSARRLAETAVDGWGLGHLEDRAGLIVSELVTNALAVVPGTEIVLAVLLRGGWVRIEVQDSSPVIPVIPSSINLTDATQECGRGLFLANAMADEFGIDRRPAEQDGGKTVWAMLRCDPDRSDDAA